MSEPIPRAVLFDFDGSLFNTLPFWYEAVLQAIAASPELAGVAISHSDVVGTLFPKFSEIVRFGHSNPDHFIHSVLTFLGNKITTADLHSGVKESLDTLRADGLKLGIVSTSSLRVIQPALENQGLQNHFATIVTRDDSPEHKPSPIPVLLALSRLGVSASHALMAGDSSVDITAGREAKTLTAALYPEANGPYYTPEQIASFNAHFVITSFASLPALVSEHLGVTRAR